MKLYYEYLGPTILAGFDTYKYSSKDTSPLSNYVMHPFWNQVSNIFNQVFCIRLFENTAFVSTL